MLLPILILHTTQATPNLCPFVISAIWGCNWSSMSQIRTDGMWPLWKQHNKKLQPYWYRELLMGRPFDFWQWLRENICKREHISLFYNPTKYIMVYYTPSRGGCWIPKGTIPAPPKKNNGYPKVMLTFYFPTEYQIFVNLQAVAGGKKCSFRW